MDEQEREAQVAAAFRAATADVPPAGFDTADVVRASRRITRRRRSAVAGAALAVLAVAGIGVTAGVSGGAGTELTTASAAGAPGAAQGDAAQGGAAQGDAAQGGAAQDAAAPEAARAAAPPPAAPSDPGVVAPAPAAGAVPPAGTPLGPGTRECADRQDPALRALVEQALPELVGAPEAMTTRECRPGGERGVVLEVSDGTSAGLLSVTSLPAGSPAAPPEGARTAPTASGGTVVVASRADRAGDPAPFADRLDAVVAALAPRL